MTRLSEEEKKVVEAVANGTDLKKIKIKGVAISHKKVEEIISDLKKRGIIKKRMVIDLEKIGGKISVFHFYKCRGGMKQIDTAADLIRTLPFVEEIHSIVGEYDIMVKFRVSSMEEYDEILNDEIWTMAEGAGIIDSMGMVSIHTYLEKAGYEKEYMRTKKDSDTKEKG